MKPIVGFVGMTHLGLVTSTAICSKGFKTICFDDDHDIVRDLSQGMTAISEPGLNKQINMNGGNQEFTSNPEQISLCNIVYISCDVPTDDEGISNLEFITELINRVVSYLNSTAILVILCQVPPGFTRNIKGIDHSRLFYQVETLVFGRAIERALYPERFIIGCADVDVPLPVSYNNLLDIFKCPILVMRYESAELAKIAINFCLISSISVANTLAEICEQIGAVWNEIVPALKLDRRIGSFSYLSPGLGLAGGNLERDIATILKIGNETGSDTSVVKAWIGNSRYRRNWAINIITRKLLKENPTATIAIWGLAYKENTNSIKNSPSLATISQMPMAYLRVHDPVVELKSIKNQNVFLCETPLEALIGADALLVLTPWDDYKNISTHKIEENLHGRIILDPYGALKSGELRSRGFNYYTLGEKIN